MHYPSRSIAPCHQIFRGLVFHNWIYRAAAKYPQEGPTIGETLYSPPSPVGPCASIHKTSTANLRLSYVNLGTASSVSGTVAHLRRLNASPILGNLYCKQQGCGSATFFQIPVCRNEPHSLILASVFQTR
jgi:hypothetical protein